MLIQNIRYAIRSLRRAPGFTLTVVLTLGLGIGANTAIFSVVRGVLLKPLPHREGDRLVYLRQSAQGAGGENVLFSVPEILDFRNSARSLKGIAEYSPMPFTLQEETEAVRVDAGLVTGNYFTIMGLSTILGRPFNDADDGTGAAPVMILTHEYWMKKFAGDSGVIGKTVRVNGQAVPIVGVLQPAPYFPGRIDVLLNMVHSEHHLSATMITGRTHRMTEMIARLAPGATLEQARAEVRDVTVRAHADYPEAYDAASGYQVTVKPFHEVLGERARLTLFLLMGAAAFVLIIACANVANLTLMRGVRREHELVVRAALGAGAARLRRLLLAENLVLTFLGGALGLLVAFGGVGMLISFAERYSPRANEIRVDGVVLGFTLTLAVVVAVILSYAPKLAKDSALGSWLAGGGKRATGNLRRQRLQRGLVVAQIAVSVVLLTGAGLLTRTMLQLSEVDTGLQPENVLTMEVPPSSYGQNNAVTVARYEEMRNQISALPGVKDVALGSVIPLRAAGFVLEVRAEGRAMAPNEPMPRAENRTASPEYFRTAGIPILKGKEFSSTDRAGSPLVVILNKTLADRLFPNQDPIGRRVAWTGEVLKFIPVSGDWRTVIGVVGDTRDGGLDAEPLPVMFQPFAQEVVFAGGLVIRAASDAATITPAATRVIRGIAPQDPIERVLTLDQIRDESVAPRRLNALLVASFGILAVIIAAVGIAGVLAFSVSARTNEIGIRMSLGADSGRVQRMVLMEGGVLLLIGLLLGVLGSVLAARLIQGLLYGVAPHDPATLASVAALMATIGLAACWLPALRAARIDPGVAIRTGN
jgi:predicted permease